MERRRQRQRQQQRSVVASEGELDLLVVVVVVVDSRVEEGANERGRGSSARVHIQEKTQHNIVALRARKEIYPKRHVIKQTLNRTELLGHARPVSKINQSKQDRGITGAPNRPTTGCPWCGCGVCQRGRWSQVQVLVGYPC